MRVASPSAYPSAIWRPHLHHHQTFDRLPVATPVGNFVSDEQGRNFFLIDGSHYDRLRSVFSAAFDLHAVGLMAFEGAPPSQAIYYRDVRDAGEEDRQRPLFGWLGHNGFDVKGRRFDPLMRGPRERYGTNLIALAVDAMALARPGDTVAIMASDVKLIPLVKALQASGVSVVLVSTTDASAAIAAHRTLVELANRFLDLADVGERVEKTGSGRNGLDD